MNQDEYIKQLEDTNRKLQDNLDSALTLVDEMYGNPLESSLTLMISSALNQQKALKNMFTSNDGNSFKQTKEIHLFLPRQIGLSTSILKACKKFFNCIDILHINGHVIIDKSDGNVVRRHISHNKLQGLRTKCIIVDPWSTLYGSNLLGWDEMKGQLCKSFDTTEPNLLILVG
jgi:frataxin-like iron-binding protein CyaY